MEATFNNMNPKDALKFWINNSDCEWDKELTIMDEELLNPVLTIDERIDGKWLRDWMALIGLDEREFYLDGKRVTPKLLEQYKSYRNVPSDDEEVTLRYGVVVSGAALTDLPTEDIFTDRELDVRYNELQETFVKVNSPVIILLEDTTHRYYYVKSIEFTGWTKQSNIAIIDDKSTWDRYFDNDSFNAVWLDEEEDAKKAASYFAKHGDLGEYAAGQSVHYQCSVKKITGSYAESLVDQNSFSSFAP